MDDNMGYDDDGDEVGPQDTTGPLEHGQTRRACDLCRARKVACDREEPCSTCVRGSAKCTYTAHQAVKPKRQRVLISAQYERKIDRIEERLNQVIDLLQTMSTASPPDTTTQKKNVLVERPRVTIRQEAGLYAQGPLMQTTETSEPPILQDKQNDSPANRISTSATPASHSDPSRRSMSVPGESSSTPDDPPFEGESSLAAHAGFASRFVEEAVQSTQGSNIHGEIGETLNSLRSLLGAQASYSFASVDYPNARPSENKKKRPMPPVQLVMSCLSIARHRADVEALWMSGFVSFDKFMQYTVDVYFSSAVTDALYLIVNIGIYWLFMSLNALQPEDGEPWPGITTDELAEACVLCRENIETCLSELPYHLPNTLDYVLALSFAGGHALEMSRPSLAWTLLGSAINICQNLGYHRASVLEQDKTAIRNQKYRVFWGLYVLEKSLALRLGRASALNDCDISLPRPDQTENASDIWETESPWYMCMAYCSGMASIQGRIYTELYSPAALRETDFIRGERAHTLINDLYQLSISTPSGKLQEFATQKVSKNSLGIGGTFYFRDDAFEALKDAIPLESTKLSLSYLVECLKIQQLCITTLIYRAVPVPKDSPSAFTPECIESARLALAAHQKIIATIPENNPILIDMYLSWTILAIPFAPFFVIFCLIIEACTKNGNYEDDLKRLEDFTASLEHGGRLSGATGRMQKLCQVLSNVARKYADVKTNAKQAASQREFDTYIHALGLFGNMNADMNLGSGGLNTMAAAAAPSMAGAAAGIGQHQQPQQAMPGIVQQEGGGFFMNAGDHQGGVQQGGQQQQQQQQQQQGALLGDWFYSGQQMLGILEQQNFDFEI